MFGSLQNLLGSRNNSSRKGVHGSMRSESGKSSLGLTCARTIYREIQEGQQSRSNTPEVKLLCQSVPNKGTQSNVWRTDRDTYPYVYSDVSQIKSSEIARDDHIPVFNT